MAGSFKFSCGIFVFISDRKCVQEWLKHAIHYGDIGRLLEPLLLIMLNPSSRRISVHYASLWKSETQSTSAKRKIDNNFKMPRPHVTRKSYSSTDSENDDDDGDEKQNDEGI